MVPLLKTLCGVKVVILLSIQPDFKDFIFNSAYGFCYGREKLKELMGDLQIKLSNVSNMFPPNLVNFIPLDLAPFIMKEMIHYTELLESKFGLTEEFSKNFIKYSIFSSNGTIDEELAARDLLKEPNLNTSVMFKVACYYCLEKNIVIIVEKQQILRKKFKKNDLFEWDFNWLWYLKEKEKHSRSDVNVNISNFEILSTFLFKLLSLAIEDDNVAAFNYVWKTVDKSKEFQNFGEYTGHKCIAVFNKFYMKWFRQLCYHIEKELKYVEKPQFYNQTKLYCNVLKFIFSQMTIAEIKDFLSHFRAHFPIAHYTLFMFLHWPYCDFFMYLAESSFCILSNDEYYGLLHNFIDLISYDNYDIPYDYRLLLREFWIKSPLHLKKQFITLEQIETRTPAIPLRSDCNNSSTTEKILVKLFLNCNFTPDDKYNFLMILKTATPQEKKSIFKFQGELICDSLISKGDYKLTDFFLQSLNVDDETKQSFKKDLVINNFPEVVKLQRLELVTQLIKWAVSSGEDKTIKQEIFSMWFEFNETADLYMESDIAISFLEEIFKLFLNNVEIAEWKQNGAFDAEFVECLVCKYCKPERLDHFLKWICYTEEKICETKENILLIILENGFSVYMPNEKLTDMIFYLCSNNRDKISEFVITLLAICETYAEKNACQHCDDSKNVFFDINKLVFRCRVHDEKLITFTTVNRIHYHYLQKLESLDAGYKNEGGNF